MSQNTSQNTDIVLDFIKAWNSRDLERILGFFSPDCVYHNIPTDPVTGVEAIRNVLQGLVNMAAEIEWIVHDVAESADGRVLTERSDLEQTTLATARAPPHGREYAQHDAVQEVCRGAPRVGRAVTAR